MSSTSTSTGVPTEVFSGLGAGRENVGFDAAPKKDVMGFEMTFDFAGDFAGDFLTAVLEGSGDGARRGRLFGGFASPDGRAPSGRLSSVPLRGRFAGGE